MDWFQNLADKAEGLLNKLDENAATVLHESNIKLPEDITNPLVSSVIDLQKETNVEVSNFVEVDERDSVRSDASSVSDKCSDTPTKVSSIVDTLTKCEEKIKTLTTENEQLREFTFKMQHLQSELQNENLNLQSQLDRANETVAITQVKIDQYSARAQRILHEKGLTSTKSDSGDAQLYSYIEQLKKDLEGQENKYAELMERFLKTSSELSVLQENFVAVQTENRKVVENLQNSLSNEVKVKLSLEEECLAKNKRLQSALNEVNTLQIDFKEKANEVLKLQKLLNKPVVISNNDLEQRLQTLTQTLMTKQNTLEAVTTERNALRFQMEKLKDEYKKATQMLHTDVKVPIETDSCDMKPQVPQFFKISPFDASVTRRVKHAYSSLDAVSIRTGVFLRRYPVARVFVFCYMVLLHVWVLIILCTGVPSSNGNSSE